MRALILGPLLALALAACASSGSPYTPQPEKTAWIVGADGRQIGQASFRDGPNGVLIRLEFAQGALPAGWHGLHLHARGDCSDFARGFQASGGHVGMDHRVQHGLLNPHGPEAGDLPNLFASPMGVFGAEVFAPRGTLGPRIPGKANQPERLALLDEDGSALLIHAGPDDQTSQPIGNAGARIACAAITPLP